MRATGSSDHATCRNRFRGPVNFERRCRAHAESMLAASEQHEQHVLCLMPRIFRKQRREKAPLADRARSIALCSIAAGSPRLLLQLLPRRSCLASCARRCSFPVSPTPRQAPKRSARRAVQQHRVVGWKNLLRLPACAGERARSSRRWCNVHHVVFRWRSPLRKSVRPDGVVNGIHTHLQTCHRLRSVNSAISRFICGACRDR